MAPMWWSNRDHHIGAMLQRLQRTGTTILIKLCFDIFDLRKMLRLAELLNMLLALFRLGLRRIDHERIVHLIVVAFVELLGKPTVLICTHREKGGRALEAKAGRGLEVALLLFVGIPLPGTGAWTGTLAGSILDMKFKDVVKACMGGVLLAGIIMGLASAGLLGALSTLFSVG